MDKKLLSCILLFFFSIMGQAQNKIEGSQPSLADTGHELYVAFSEEVHFDGPNYKETLLGSIPEMKVIEQEFHLQCEKGIAISDEQLNFMESEAVRISKNSQSVRKLRNILKVTIDNPTNERLQVLSAKLEKLPQVRYCSLMSTMPVPPPADITPTTTNYEPNQTYLQANPGVNMSYAWGLGLTGSGIRIRDVEYGFNKNHEDLADVNASIAAGMTVSSSASVDYTEHGTAVLGIVYADKGTYGISGMAYGAQEMVQFPEWQEIGYNRVNAVAQAVAHSIAGDVIIYEMQTGGQNSNYVPAEFNAAVWDLTKAATDAGIIIVAAAGNGNENLDGAYYTAYRNRGDSGAIIVGAGSASLSHQKLSYSTYGSRVDVQGWGTNVRATGYGDYSIFGGDFNQQYTNFSGTSSATPIVASCAVVLQSYYHGLSGNYLTSIQMRDLLKLTGIPQGTGGNIGPLPNMQAAIQHINALLSTPENARVVFTVFPNPVKDRIAITIEEEVTATAKMEISNSLGQIVYTTPIISGKNEVSLANFQNGLYFVKITNNGKTSVRKIVKQ
ncbi:S8/S53 family peptidase [Flavobacterium humi]|uniref:T9SS type A sorting domain-containing protein n=1 Tax=Flavobacterium humi TaxID=2562683 RepID=A0A4Z0L6C6_9FLAO|nr:S8/S53 family peptidase [Flavobacterium humi]TGD57957.1 T9SS type A sorting domain-containing protein [Flavobacterium humi]